MAEEKRKQIGDGDKFTLEGYTFVAEVSHDEGMGAPWDEHDGHGVVSDWTTREAEPGELVLSQDRDTYRYYDVNATTEIAKRDGWGVSDEQAAGKTKDEIVAMAVQRDYEDLKSWCNDEWYWVYCSVTLLDINGQRTKIHQSVGGIESSEGEYISDSLYELAEEIIANLDGRDELKIRLRGENAERKAMAEKLAAYYSKKLNGKVWCHWEPERHAYEIRGEGLPAHPDLQHLYSNGWSMLDYVSEEKAKEVTA